MLSWFEAIVVPMSATRQANTTVEGPGYIERARAAESLGQVDVARDYYQRFVVRYDAPTPFHRYLVGDAKQALVRLGPAGRDQPRR